MKRPLRGPERPDPGPPALNPATRTLYVPYGNAANRVAVINAATCNAQHTSGCPGHHPTVTVGRSPISVAADSATGTVYVSDFSSAAISVINGTTCRAGAAGGCRRPAPLQPAGSQPFGISVNQNTSSVYVTQLFQTGSMSILRAG